MASLMGVAHIIGGYAVNPINNPQYGTYHTAYHHFMEFYGGNLMIKRGIGVYTTFENQVNCPDRSRYQNSSINPHESPFAILPFLVE